MIGAPRLNGVQSNALPATPSFALLSIATSSSANTKNAFSAGQVFASLPLDTNLLEVVVFGYGGTGGTNLKGVFDIGIGASGSETPIITDVPCGWCSLFADNTAFGTLRTYYFPVFIPAGTRVAFRHQCTTGSQNAKVGMWAHSGLLTHAHGVYRRAETYGVTLASTSGTAISPGADGATWGSWTNVGSTTSRNYYGLFPSIMGHLDTSVTPGWGVMQVGLSSGAVIFGEWLVSWAGTEIGAVTPCLPVPCFVPSGSQLQARIRGAGNTEASQYGITCFY